MNSWWHRRRDGDCVAQSPGENSGGFLGFIHGRARPWGVVRSRRTRSDTQLNSNYIKSFLKNRIWTKFWNTIPLLHPVYSLTSLASGEMIAQSLSGFLPCSIVPKQVLNQSASIEAIWEVFLSQRTIKKRMPLFVIHGDYPGICQLRADMNFQTDGKKGTVSSPGF